METAMDYINNNNSICHNRKDIARLKSNLTLDIDSGRSAVNGIDLTFSGRLEDGVLSTPDVGLLKLATPELERLVLQQYLQQQQLVQLDQATDGSPEQRPVQLSHEDGGDRSVVVAEVSKSDEPLADAVELRASAGLCRSATSVGPASRQLDRYFVGLHSELGAYDGFDGFGIAVESSNAGSSIFRELDTAVSSSANAWSRSFCDRSSMVSVSDHAGFAPSIGPQFSPSSVSTSGAAPTPPPSKAERRRCATTVTSGYRRPVSTTASSCDEFTADDVKWRPSAAKRACYGKFDIDEDDSVSSVSSSLTTTAAGVETPPISPIDMAAQERIKIERKRARNRLAATRCRNRKLERIATLQDQADRLRSTNAQLAAEVGRLRSTVYQLRRDVARHSAAGCQPLGATALIPGVFPVLHQQHQYQHQQSAFMRNAAIGVNGSL
jgi:hypothetical protein